MAVKKKLRVADVELTEVSIGMGVTIGLPDYSSARVDAVMKARIHEGQNPDEVREILRNRLGAAMVKDTEYLATVARKIIEANS